MNRSTKKFWLKTELLEALEEYDIKISPDMLVKDLYAMRYETGLSFQNAPIKYNNPKGYYYNTPFSITMPFDDDDLRLLEKAAQTLNQFKDINYFNQFAGAVDKIVRLIKQTKKTQLNEDKHYILFEKVPYLRGYQHLDLIIDTIEKKKCLSMTYQKFDHEQATEIILHPYFVKEFHNRWYVIGLNSAYEQIRTYALDRIKDVSLCYEDYKENDLVDPETYFRDCIGINLANNKIEKVILSFTPFQGNYIKTQHIHRSQEILLDTEQELLVKLDIIINHELIMNLLSYGANVKIVEPVFLEKQIAAIASSTLALYQLP